MHKKHFFKFSLFSIIRPWRISLKMSSGGVLGFVSRLDFSVQLETDFVAFCKRHQISAGIRFSDGNYSWFALEENTIHQNIYPALSHTLSEGIMVYESCELGWQPIQ